VKPLKNGEEKNRWKTEEKIGEKTEEKKKWTETADGGTYMAVLPTDIKLIIILIYSVGEVSKIRR
jgi:hypothetical protein